MPGRHFLFVPGPTNVPDRVLRAMHRAQEDHRSSAFPELPRSLFADLKRVFRTTAGHTFIFPATGTAMWEASLVNALSPGDRVLSVRLGQFSHLFIDCAQRLGLRADVIDLEWDESAPSDRIAHSLAADSAHAIKAVLIVHNETATGVTSDIGASRRAMDDAAALRPPVRRRRQFHRQPRLPLRRVEGRLRHRGFTEGVHDARWAGASLRERQGAGAGRRRAMPAGVL